MNNSTLVSRFKAQCDTGILAISNQHSPTIESIKFIENQLGVMLPETFVTVACQCLAYTDWFAGIGRDYEWSSHILAQNKNFHDGEDAFLPSNLILFTKGYDSIYACFDLSNRDENGNVSIVYCYLSEVDNSIEIQDIEHISYSFDIYLDLVLSRWENKK
jgi:hypothetical protein